MEISKKITRVEEIKLDISDGEFLNYIEDFINRIYGIDKDSFVQDGKLWVAKSDGRCSYMEFLRDATESDIEASEIFEKIKNRLYSYKYGTA